MEIKKNFTILFWIIISSLIFAIILVNVVNSKVSPGIASYSEIEAKRFGTYMINYSLDKNFVKELDNNIFEIVKNSDGEVQLIDFRAKEANLLLENVTKRVQNNLIKLENGNIKDIDLADTFYGLRFKKINKGVVCEIPTGMLLSDTLLANNGPVIPIKLNFIGQVMTHFKTEVKSYGINSVYLTSSIQIEVRERITMPSRTKEVVVKTEVPLSIKVVQGSIPDYYLNSLTKDSASYSLPVE